MSQSKHEIELDREVAHAQSCDLTPIHNAKDCPYESGGFSYETPNCTVCNERSLVEIDYDGWYAWQKGALIQNAFPGMSADKRELLKTGIHPDCWNKIFGIGPSSPTRVR